MMNQLVRMTSQPTYRGEPIVKVELAGTSSLITTSSVVGVFAGVNAVSPGTAPGFSSRFGTSFDECRLLSCVAEMYPLTNSPGVTNFYWSEKSVGTPTLSEAQQRAVRVLSNSNGTGNSKYTMTWKADGFQDLSWDPVGSSVPAVYFNIYTDNANYAAPTSTTIFLIKYRLTVQFRGVASQ